MKKIKKNLNTIILAIIIIVALFAASYAQLFSVVEGQLNTTTQIKSIHMWCGYMGGSHYRDSWGYTGGDEVLQRQYATSWTATGDSEIISLYGGYKPGLWSEWMSPLVYLMMPYFSRGYWKVEVSTQNQGSNEWITVIGQRADGTYGVIDSTIIDYIQGPAGLFKWVGAPINQDWNGTTHTGGLNYCSNEGDPSYDLDMFALQTPDDQNSSLVTPPTILQFRLKGQIFGGIRVSLVIACQVYSHDFGGDCSSQTHVAVLKDEAYLYSGSGYLDVLDNPLAPAGLERYYEEGQTVITDLTTNYAGTNNTGWLVKASRRGDPIVGMTWTHGATAYTTGSTGCFALGNNLGPGYDISWTVPSGWWNPDGSNDIIMSLYNSILTLWGQDDTFTLYQGGFEDCPGQSTTIITNLPANGKFLFGDTVEVDVSANINTGATPPYNTITEFELNAYCNNPYQTFYHGYTQVINDCGGNCRSCHFSFTWTIDANEVIIEGRAWAGNHSQGGLPGGYGTTAAQMGPEAGYTLTVVVKSVQKGITHLIQGATVTIGATFTEITNSRGQVRATDMTEGTYLITATADGYKSSAQHFYLGAGKTVCTFNLQPGADWILIILSIVFTAVVLIIFIVVSVLIIPPYRYILLVVGISLSIAVFYVCYFTDILANLLAGLW